MNTFGILMLLGCAVLATVADFALSNTAQLSEFDTMDLDNDIVHSRSKRSVKVSEADRTLLLAIHNRLRRIEDATDMTEMVWNDDLQDMAASWSDGCDFNHGGLSMKSGYSYTRVGQNLYATGVRDLNFTHAIERFYYEKPDYIWAQKKCKSRSVMCGHYTQVVWAKSNTLGCAWNWCNRLKDAYRVPRGWMLTCNYGPPGNYVGQHPYKKTNVGLGKCSQCPKGNERCFNGLCVADCSGRACTCEKQCQNCGTLDSDTCTCKCPAGYVGDSCEKDCKDGASRCGSISTLYCSVSGRVSANVAQYISKMCPKLCGICDGPDPNFVCGATTPATTTTPKATTTPKMTTAENCAYLRDNKICQPGGKVHQYSMRNRRHPGKCVCRCYRQYDGATCKEFDSSVEGVIEYTKIVRIRKSNTDAFKMEYNRQISLAASQFNYHCARNVPECCIGASNIDYFLPGLRFQTRKFVEKNPVLASSGYPRASMMGRRHVTTFKFYAEGGKGRMCVSAYGVDAYRKRKLQQRLKNRRSKRDLDSVLEMLGIGGTEQSDEVVDESSSSEQDGVVDEETSAIV